MFEQGFYREFGSSNPAAQQASTPMWLDMLSAAPGSTTYMAFNVGRVGRTMTDGARRGLWKPSNPKYLKSAVSNNNLLNPKAWGRFNTDQFLTSPETAKYTPFQLAKMGDWTANKFAKLGKNMDSSTKLGRLHAASEAAGGKAQFFAQGSVGRMSASSRIMKMSDKKFAKAINPERPNFMGKTMGGMHNLGATRESMSRAVLLQGGGKLSGRALGFMAGARDMQRGGVVVGSLSDHGATKYSKAGYQSAVKMANQAKAGTRLSVVGAEAGGGRALSAAGGKAIAKAGASRAALYAGKTALAAARFAGPVGAALLVFDAAKLVTKAGGYIARTSVQAANSATQGLRAPIGGNAFVDTTASMTSRSRGVAAIQNSRMNARSVLGNEAASMAGYMG